MHSENKKLAYKKFHCLLSLVTVVAATAVDLRF